MDLVVDAEFAGAGLCAPCLQADPALFHGRDRRCVGFQERFYRRKLHQGPDQKCTIYHYLFEVCLLALVV